MSDIQLMGATYPDVPAVKLPKSGGGEATFTEVGGSQTYTQNGTYDVSALSEAVVNVSGGGGGGGGNVDDPIRFFDYDGTLVASCTSVPSSLPPVPSHNGLTNGTWNHTLVEIGTQFAAVGTCDVGANYDTASGGTELDCVFLDGRLSPRLRVAPNGTVTVDWGDGTEDTVLTGTSMTTAKTADHTYARAGEYTITITPASGTTYGLYNSSSATLLLRASGSSANLASVYANCIKAVRLGVGCQLRNYSFVFCRSLESVSIPGSMGYFGNYAFNNCYSLHHVTVPHGVTSIGSYSFYNCYSLVSVSLPSSATTINDYAFTYCYALPRVSIPTGITGIGNYMFQYCSSMDEVVLPHSVRTLSQYAFQYCHSLRRIRMSDSLVSTGTSTFGNCYSLTSVTVPSNVTSIGSSFSGCYGLGEIHFKPTTPPTVVSTTFSNVQSDCTIYVPAGTLTAYTTATNYPNPSTFTYVEE